MNPQCVVVQQRPDFLRDDPGVNRLVLAGNQTSPVAPATSMPAAIFLDFPDLFSQAWPPEFHLREIPQVKPFLNGCAQKSRNSVTGVSLTGG
jgi:hypothetical protein